MVFSRRNMVISRGVARREKTKNIIYNNKNIKIMNGYFNIFGITWRFKYVVSVITSSCLIQSCL